MPKISPLDTIIQQLDDLSLDQLLEVRARVDALIEEKSSHKNESQEYPAQTLYFSLICSERNKPAELEATENSDSLKKVIDLVGKWMADESGYDEETYPQIEAALNQNHLSL